MSFCDRILQRIVTPTVNRAKSLEGSAISDTCRAHAPDGSFHGRRAVAPQNFARNRCLPLDELVASELPPLERSDLKLEERTRNFCVRSKNRASLSAGRSE